MKSLLLALPLVAAVPLVVPPSAPPSREHAQDEDMAAMMAKAQRYLTPGEHHAFLERFVGEWETTSQITMGPEPSPPAPGHSTFEWKVEGRWLESRFTGDFMGMPLTVYMWLGYDNFKQSYVMTKIDTVDTAMNRAEGDLTQERDALIMYGTLDEYLTGEHDKMVKYLWRFPSKDEMVLEVHDLPIGETNTKVVEFRYTREKEGR